jgi:hypothetical protein
VKIPSKISLKTALIFLVIGILITSGLFYVFAATPSSTFYISSGVYPGAPSFTVWTEGSNYFAKDANGLIVYSGTNRTTVINNAINALPHVNVQLPNAAASVVSAPHGKIIIKAGAYPDSGSIQVPLGSRITIEGEGTSQQMVGNGINGGTQIINSGTASAFECLATSGAVTSTGTILVLKNIEFVQQVNLASSQIACLNLDGMAQGILENVQVVRKYGETTPLTGVGIKCINNIGGDHAGGDTLWMQVQVCGFTYGLNCSIDHWKAIQLDIANCTTGFQWYNNLATRLEDVHIFQCDRIFALYGGFTEYGHVQINGLYLEECGGGVGGYEWYVDSTFHGYCRIYDTNVNVVAGAGTLWRCNDNATLWFEDVMTAGGAPSFPSVSTPATTDDERFMNDKLQAVEVFVFWSDIVDIEINGEQVTTTDDLSACFFLRPGDTIQIDVDGAGSYSWYWRGVSAERGHQDD